MTQLLGHLAGSRPDDGPTPAGSHAERSTAPAAEPAKLDLDQLARLGSRELVLRFAFGFAVTVVAGILVEVVDPVFGGLFLAFPAILPATVTLVERKSGVAQAVGDVRGALAGALAMVVFAWVARSLLGRTPVGIAVLGAFAAWLVAAAALYGAARLLVRVLGENHYLPEVPTREAGAVLDALHERDLTIATAESCTGGLVAGFFTSVPGASEVFRGSVVAYDGEVKQRRLGVDPRVLEERGAVCAAVAAQMARNVRGAIGADVGLGVTGNTGGAAEGQPRGVTYLAVAAPGRRTLVRRYTDDFGPGRNDERAVRMAFKAVTDALGDPEPDEHDVEEWE